MATTYISDLGSLIAAEYIEENLIKEARASLVIVPNMRQKDISNLNTLTYSFPKLPTTNAAAVAETVDLTATTMTPTDTTITASEVGIMYAITKKGSVTSKLTPDDMAQAGGRAMGAKMDTDAAALFAALNSGTPVGSTGSNFTYTNYDEALYTLEVNNAMDYGDPVCILHPRQASDLRLSLQGTYSSFAFEKATELINRKGYVGSWLGVPIYQTTVCPTANTAADRVGAMFIQKHSLGMVVSWKPEVEYQKDASARVTEVVITSCYGVGEIDDLTGVSIVTDA